MFEKATTGQDLISTPIGQAAFINELVDVVESRKASANGVSSNSSNLTLRPNSVFVRNVTGGNLSIGHVVQLGSELLTIRDQDNPWFAGNTPVDPAVARYAVMGEPLPNSLIGEAYVSGRCLAIVNVGNITHTHASPSAASKILTSGASGPIEILSPLGSTGNQTVWVRLGPPTPRPTSDSYAGGRASGGGFLFSGDRLGGLLTNITPGDDGGSWIQCTDPTQRFLITLNVDIQQGEAIADGKYVATTIQLWQNEDDPAGAGSGTWQASAYARVQSIFYEQPNYGVHETKSITFVSNPGIGWYKVDAFWGGSATIVVGQIISANIVFTPVDVP